jgi:AcrR family transcriptional regulator
MSTVQVKPDGLSQSSNPLYALTRKGDPVQDHPLAPPPTPADGSARRRLPPEERREEILEAALAVFSELSFDRATLKDVADRAGVTKGAVYHYFDSKEQLFIALLRQRILPHIEAGEELLATATGSREEILEQLLARAWRHYQQPGQIELAILAMNELPKIPEVGRILFDEVVQRGRRTMRQALARGVERGEIAWCDIDAAAAVVPYMILGVALGHRLFRGIDPLTLSAERLGTAATRTLLRGVGARSPGGCA